MDDVLAGTRLALAAPTVADLRAAILRAARGDETVWADVCEAARNAPFTGAEHDVRDRLVRAAKAQPGAVRVAALSFEIRLNSHRNLTALTTARPS